MLKVEADDTEDMVTMDSEAERTLQDRIQILERHFNIKVIVLDLKQCFGSGFRVFRIQIQYLKKDLKSFK